MVRTRRFLFSKCSALIVVASVLFWHCTGLAAEPLATGDKALLANYPAIKAKLEKNQFGTPIYLESAEKEGSLRVDVYGVLNYPFDAVRDALQSPVNWCDIMSLHTNIKACTFRKAPDHWLLTLYSGRKYYQSPQDAYKLEFMFRIAAQQPEYLDITMTADNGPLLTTDHRIRLEAAPLDKGTTFVHFRYAYKHGLLARMAIKTYFATLAHDKVGFSSSAADKMGNPVYTGGVRGAIERNAVRYYLALRTYMDTFKSPGDQRFEKQINRWYNLTASFPRQLYEMDKEEYLATKRREHNNQLMLQKEADQ
jgi:hypothetical protein